MRTSVKSNESGMAIITALLVLMLASGLMAGMFAALIADQRSHATDRDQSMAYAAAHAGLEKLTAEPGALLRRRLQPERRADRRHRQLSADDPELPVHLAGRRRRLGLRDHLHARPRSRARTPATRWPSRAPTSRPGRFEGLQGPDHALHHHRDRQVDDRQLRSAAAPRAADGGRAGVPVRHLRREVLGFHAGPNFDFGGRVHTNQACTWRRATATTLTFRDKITAFTQVVRDTLMNGAAITRPTTPAPCRCRPIIGVPGLAQPAGHREQRHHRPCAAGRRLLDRTCRRSTYNDQHPHRGHRRQAAQPAAGHAGRRSRST